MRGHHLAWFSVIAATVILSAASVRATVVKFETKNEKLEFDLDESVEIEVDDAGEFDNVGKDYDIGEINDIETVDISELYDVGEVEVDDRKPATEFVEGESNILEPDDISLASSFDTDAEYITATQAKCPGPHSHCRRPARPCDKCGCRARDGCRCSGDDIPSHTPPSRTPQMIILSFQNAVTDTNINLYLDLFEGRKNPNGCPATGSFYVSGKYTNYYNVQALYSKGHEIGNNGAEESTLPDYWFNANVNDWCRQIVDNRNMLTKFGNVKSSDIQGFRTPYLYMGGNTQLEAYTKCNVSYDATRVALNYKHDPNLMWPYSYKCASTQDCPIGICANASFPGVWQVPLEALPDPRNVPCAELQGCYLHNKTQVYSTLKEAFLARYRTNKAPMMIAISTAFLLTDYKANGLAAFLDSVKKYNDVYIVTAAQALAWTKSPCTCAFGCKHRRPPLCAYPKTCNYDRKYRFVPRGAQGIIYVMKACVTRCPACYPRLGDSAGNRC